MEWRGKPRIAVMVAAAMLVSACSGAQPRTDGAPANPLIGRVLDLEAPLLEGGAEFKLSDLRGKVVLLDVWASWCVPCRAALKAYAGMARRHGRQGLKVVGLGVDEDREAGKRYAEAIDPSITLLWDEGQKRVPKLHVEKMPTALLIGRDGRVAAVFGGYSPAHAAEIEKKIAQLLGG